MGSGWAPAADAFGGRRGSVAIGELPGFAAPTAVGHGGEIRSVRVGDRKVLLFLGRTHLYEGRGVEPVVHGVRTAAAAGVRTVVLTNAAGGLAPDHRVGQAVLISRPPQPDRPLAAGRRELRRPDRPLLRPAARRWPARSTRRWPRASTRRCPARTTRRRPRSGCCARSAPTWSACPRRWRRSPPGPPGMEVFGLSMVTNAAAGITGEELDHQEVLAAGKAAAGPARRSSWSSSSGGCREPARCWSPARPAGSARGCAAGCPSGAGRCAAWTSSRCADAAARRGAGRRRRHRPRRDGRGRRTARPRSCTWPGIASESHLAGDQRTRNIEGTYCALEAARRAGVPRVVLASSNHATGFTPAPGAGPAHARPTPRRGRTPTTASPRWRWRRSARCTPTGTAWTSSACGSAARSPSRRRRAMLATWLSPADTVVAGRRRAAAPVARVRRRLGRLGQHPQLVGPHRRPGARATSPPDDAEVYAEALIEAHGEPDPADPVHARVGGEYTLPEFDAEHVEAASGRP